MCSNITSLRLDNPIEDFFDMLRAKGGKVWLTQVELAELFQISIRNVNAHVKNVLTEGELTPEATIRESLIVQGEGTRQVRRLVKSYSLDMILAVGYRVKSPRGAQFRQWPTAHLKEYIVKGFIMDDARLKDAADITELKIAERRLVNPKGGLNAS